MNAILLDIATAPHPRAADWIEAGKPPGNYSKPESIAKWQDEDRAEKLERAGLDADLCVVTVIGTQDGLLTARNETEEAEMLSDFAKLVRGGLAPAPIVGYNVKFFDLTILKRRARYLGVDFPQISTDRYRNDRVIDLCESLYGDPSKRKSLDFLCRRLGWTDLCPKPMSGAEESQVFQHGRWDDLRASVARDVEAVRRLGMWAGVI